MQGTMFVSYFIFKECVTSERSVIKLNKAFVPNMTTDSHILFQVYLINQAINQSTYKPIKQNTLVV